MLNAILNLLYFCVTYCNERNVSKKSNCPGQGGMKHLYGKNHPAQAGIPVAETLACVAGGFKGLGVLWRGKLLRVQ